MKYKNKIIIAVVLVAVALCTSYAVDAYQNLLHIKDKVIRLHVIANSDTIEDQELKLKVRNKIITDMNKEFEDISSKKESEEIIISKLQQIKEKAEEVIKENNFDYEIKIYYGNFDFPTKQYENIILPSGNYDAVRIVIGEGKGQNWWCVMFPPLCFVDFGKVENEEEATFDIDTEEKLSEILTEEEIEMIKINRGLSNIKLKSKIAEIVERGKIENAGIDADKQEKEVYAAVKSITWGAKGKTVREIQTKLKNWGYYDGAVDGDFGQKTFEAVKKFQQKNGIAVDGIVGPRTAEALGISLEKAQVTYEDNNATSVDAITWGAKGNTVKDIQTKLKNWGYYDGAVDGDFGQKTFEAVKKFQQKNGIAVDGIVGPVTAEALGISLQNAQVTYDEQGEKDQSISRDDNIYLLAKAVYGESRGEPYIGQVAVASVVLNRVEHSDFPNTIAGVIYQPGAFTAVYDGQINLQPDAAAVKAANDALNGWDPTYGCRYYWNPATASSKWIWSRQVVVKIGKHWFGN